VISYQWYYNGVAILGETNVNLSLPPITRFNSGVYSVLVTSSTGYHALFAARVRAMVPPILNPPTFASNGTRILQFRDADGGLPVDPSQVALYWRTNPPSGQDTNWQTVPSAIVLTNGLVTLFDTNTPAARNRFYRVLEY